MIEYFAKLKTTEEIEKVPKFVKGCWISVSSPNEEELKFLTKEFNLNLENLLDGIDIHENPRLEIENKLNYIYLTVPTDKIKQEHDSSFLIISSKDFFMTVSKNSLEMLEKILGSKKIFKDFSSSRNLLRILFFLSRSFENSVRRVMKEIKSNRADLNKLRNKDIVKLINNEDKLSSYISSFGAIIHTYNKILRERSLKFLKKDQERIENLIIDLNETLILCKQTLKTISNMRDYYSTKLSNDLNKTVTLLTIFTIFLSIPTLFSSIYGMNVVLPYQSSINLLPVLGALIIGIWFLMLYILKRMKVI